LSHAAVFGDDLAAYEVHKVGVFTAIITAGDSLDLMVGIRASENIDPSY